MSCMILLGPAYLSRSHNYLPGDHFLQLFYKTCSVGSNALGFFYFFICTIACMPLGFSNMLFLLV